MKQDDFVKNITAKLDGLAQRHPAKPEVMNHVLEHIQNKKTQRYGLWKMSGFALAAAIAGITILPQANLNSEPSRQAVVSPKLSPQMVEDLEMLMVLGEEQRPHES